MLRIAVPNKGSLSEASVGMLKEAGYRQRYDQRDLILQDAENDVEFYFLRPRDIAVYVGSGQLDAGITGRDLLLDSAAPAHEILQLGFGGSTFHYATTPDRAADITGLTGLRIATSYPVLVAKHLADNAIAAKVVRLDGAVEGAVRLGVADAIADVVSTGTTLRQAGLEVLGAPILVSEAILIMRDGADRSPGLELVMRRLQGVIIARKYVLMDYDVREELVADACKLTPGIESPTISPLQESGWVAVRAMVLRKDTNRIMDELWDLGARGILVTDIHACRL